MSQLGHFTDWPHARHQIDGAYPRRLRNKMICPSPCSTVRMADSSARPIAAPREQSGSFRTSTTITGGSGRRSTRLGSETSDVLAFLRAKPRFERRRGRAEDQRNPLQQGPLPRDVACVIPRRRFLLERRLVLLVDHDQAQMGRRGEDRAARADHDLHAAGGNLLPVPVPLRVAQMAVQDGDGIEPSAEAADRLRRQADLGHQHDGLSAVTDDLADRLDIDFGFAAPRDAMQQDRAVPARSLRPPGSCRGPASGRSSGPDQAPARRRSQAET